MPDAQPRPAPAPRLAIPLGPFGPYQALSLQVHELTVHGRNSEALACASP